MQIILVLFDKDSLSLSKNRFDDIKEYIDNNYVENHNSSQSEKLVFRRNRRNEERPRYRPKLTVEELLEKQEETFSQMVLRVMTEKEMKPAEVYGAANLDRKIFSKIKTNINFHPNKITAISIAVGLKLNLEETQKLLAAAGYSLSYSDKFDLIIMYCLENNIYKYMEINFLLDDYGLEVIGQRVK